MHICVTTKNACMHASIKLISLVKFMFVDVIKSKYFQFHQRFMRHFIYFMWSQSLLGWHEPTDSFLFSHDCRLVYALFVLFTFSWMLTIFWISFSRNGGTVVWRYEMRMCVSNSLVYLWIHHPPLIILFDFLTL